MRCVAMGMLGLTMWLAAATPVAADDGPVAMIPAGTVVDAAAPEGYTHLVIKSWPQVGAGDVASTPQRDIDLAQTLFSAVVVRIAAQSDSVQQASSDRGDEAFQIVEVATGAGTSIKGRDRIITPETQAELGADFGFLARQLLSAYTERLKQVRYAALRPQLAVVDAPGVFRIEEKNVAAMLRYLMLVDKQSGHLDTFVVQLQCDEAMQPQRVIGPMHHLAAACITRPTLYVDRNEYNVIGIPSDVAFAAIDIPPAQTTIDLPEKAAAMLAKPALSDEDTDRLQPWLQRIQSQLTP
jgi:hypothetical protein